MTETPLAELASLLFARVAAIDPALTIAWPNTAQTIEARPYLDVALIPMSSGFLGHSGLRKYVGLLQISVVAERGDGLIRASEIADQIATAFPQNLTLHGDGLTLELPTPPAVHAPVYDGPDMRLPVSISYQSFI